MRFRTDLETRRYVELAVVAAVVGAALGVATVLAGLDKVYVYDDGSSVSQAVEQQLWFVLSVPLSAAAPLLALRRPYVAAAAALVLPLGSLIFGLSMFSAFAGALATGAVLLRRSTWAGVVVSVAALGLPAVVTGGGTMVVPDGSLIYNYGGSPVGAVVAYPVVVLLVLLAGLGFRTWSRNERAQARLEADRLGVDRHAAVLGERSRLARDLHDVVAHHVSLIAVRAETAPYTVDDLSPGARVVLADIADDSRRALDELRGVLGVLQRSQGDQPALAPQPGVPDVAELVEHARQAGAVSYDGEAALAVLDQARGYVAYRVVQEALTNARRHAAGQQVSVSCEPTPAGARVVVANRDTTLGPVVPGRGLTGMQERVEAVGGVLDVVRADGAFRVEAVLPA